MRNSIYHAKNDFGGIRSHNPTKLLCVSAKIQCTRDFFSLTGSSSHAELNRPGAFWRKQLQPGRWDDSKLLKHKGAGVEYLVHVLSMRRDYETRQTPERQLARCKLLRIWAYYHLFLCHLSPWGVTSTQ